MRHLIAGILCLLAVAASGAPAWADAMIERFSRSDGFAGMGAFESTTVTMTSASAQREEASLKFTGAFLGALQRMAGAGDSVRITRLDRDLVWTLDQEKKTYTEAPLTAAGERERPAPGQGSRPKEKAEPSDVVVTRSEFKVEKTGARKTINAFPCEEYLVTWLVETRNQKTGETGKSLMTTRLWTTPVTAEIRAAQAEEVMYSQAYLKKLGLQASPEESRKFGLWVLGTAGLNEQEQQRAVARLASEMAKVQGYTIVTQVEWNVEGSGGTAESREGAPGGGGSPGVGELLGGLGKLFGGGGQRGGAESSRGGDGKSGALFSLYTEVKRIRAVSHEAGRFEVPPGYARK